MNSFSNVTIVGRLTRNAEMTNTPTGSSSIRFSVAIDYRRRQDDGTFVDDPTFIDVRYITSNPSLITFLEKGTQVGVVGELFQSKWVTNEGLQQSKIIVRANNVHLIESKEASDARKARYANGASYSSDRSQGNNAFASRASRGDSYQSNQYANSSMNFESQPIQQSRPAPQSFSAPQNSQQNAPSSFGPDSFEDNGDIPF